MTLRVLSPDYWSGFFDGLIIAAQIILIGWIAFDIFRQSPGPEVVENMGNRVSGFDTILLDRKTAGE